MRKTTFRLKQAKIQFAVCLCLFSVLIIYFAPLFSQIAQAFPEAIKTQSIAPTSIMVMQEHDHEKMGHHLQTSNIKQTSAQISDKHVSINEHSGHQGHQDHQGHQGHHAEGAATNLLEACGYCALLFHLSWLDVKTFNITPIKPIHYPNLVFSTVSRKYHLPFTSILPRAPPHLTS
ncbi:MAG: DUF2946 domain-containing protein [Marinomonas colpomeniae]